MSELQHTYEEAEARAIESAKAAVKEARRKMEAYDNLAAAARAVVADWDRWADEPWNPDEPHWANFAVTLDALRAAVEAADQGPADTTYHPVQPHE